MHSKLTQNITIKELQAQIEALKAELDKERRNNCVAYSELECLQTAVHFAYSVLERTVVWLRDHLSGLANRDVDVLQTLVAESTLAMTELRGIPSLHKHFEKSFEKYDGPLAQTVEQVQKAAAEAKQHSQLTQKRAVEQMLKTKRCIQDNNRKSGKIKDVVGQAALSEAELHPENEMLKAAAQIAAAQTPACPNEKKPLLGKQADPSRATAPTLKSEVRTDACDCPHCRAQAGLIAVKGRKAFVRTCIASLDKLLQSAFLDNPVFQCNACGKYHMHLPEDLPIPAGPTRTVSQELLFESARLFTHGVPMNRLNDILNTGASSMSPETIPRNMHDWINSGLGRPLVDAIKAKAQQEDVICVDETPFSCLQQAGMSKKQLADDDAAKQAYLLTMTSPASASYQFAAFNRLQSRSADSLESVLKDYKATTYITDAYAGYGTVIRNSTATIKRQSCLAHLTRVVYDALDLANMEKSVSNPKNKGKLREALVESSPAYYLTLVTDAISKIYDWEMTLKPIEDEEAAAWKTRVEECRKEHALPLMDNIDTIMRKLAEKYAVKKGSTWEAKLESPYSKPIVYYMNGRENFRVFLENANVTSDSSAAERSLRPICVLRNSSSFKQSQEYMESMCDWFTLFVTAKLNGIERPTQCTDGQSIRTAWTPC